jgi:hypothetical protein
MGDGYLRKLLVVGATSVIRRARTAALAAAPWIRSLLERRPARVVTVAKANKTARIAWAVLACARRGLPSASHGLNKIAAANAVAQDCQGAIGLMMI